MTAPRTRTERVAHFTRLLAREQEHERQLGAMLLRYESAQYSVGTVDAICETLAKSTARILALQDLLRSLDTQGEGGQR